LWSAWRARSKLGEFDVTSYATWVAGYADTTASIALGTVSDFGADQVQAALIARQLDSSVKTYQGHLHRAERGRCRADIIQTS
jgi:hypothetical protein